MKRQQTSFMHSRHSISRPVDLQQFQWCRRVQMEDVANNWAMAVFRLLELLPKHPAIPHLQIGGTPISRSSRASQRAKAVGDGQTASKEVIVCMSGRPVIGIICIWVDVLVRIVLCGFRHRLVCCFMPYQGKAERANQRPKVKGNYHL